MKILVPSLGESVSEATVAKWLKKEGDYVEKDQAIAEVDSDKATLELPAEISGTITLKAEEGDAVNVGSVVCLIDSEGKSDKVKKEVVSDSPKSSEPVKEVKVESNSSYASGTPAPAAKKIIEENL